MPRIEPATRKSEWWSGVAGFKPVCPRSHKAKFLKHPAEVESKYDKKLRSLREELELRRKTEIHEIEEVRKTRINR